MNEFSTCGLRRRAFLTAGCSAALGKKLFGFARADTGTTTPERGTVEWRSALSSTNGIRAQAVAADAVLTYTSRSLFAINRDDGSRRWRYDGPPGELSTDLVDGAVVLTPGVLSGDDWITAVDLEDGTVRWEVETGGWTFTHGSPDGKTIAVNVGGSILALDASDGTERWRRSFGKYRHTDVGAVTNDTVYAGVEGGTAHAFDASDGTEQWRFDTGGGEGTTTTLHDGTVYVLADAMYALSPETGERRWEYYPPGEGPLEVTAVDGDTAYVVTGSADVYAVDVTNGTVRWSAETEGDGTNFAGQLLGETFYVDNPGVLYAIDATDGTIRWTYEAEKPEVASLPPTMITVVGATDDVAVVWSEAGRVYGFDVDSGEVRWQLAVPKRRMGYPFVDSGMVYAPHGEELWAFDANDGTPAWRVDVDVTGFSRLALTPEYVYAGGDYALYAIERTATGSSARMPGFGLATGAVAFGVLAASLWRRRSWRERRGPSP